MVNLTAVQKLKIPVIFEIRVDSEQVNRIQLELELFSEFLVDGAMGSVEVRFM